MTPDASDRDLLHAWNAGDQDAAAVLFRRYQVRLMALIRSRLSKKLARRIDPEDVLLSAYRSFFLAARNGRAALTVDADLWPLLTTFTLRKLAHQARRHTANRRTIDQEQEFSAWLDVIRHEPTPEHAAMLAEEIERLMAQLDETAREVLVRTLQGHDATQIAAALGLHERSVRRALERVRKLLPADGSWPAPSNMSIVSAVRSHPSIATTTTTYDQYLLQQFVGVGAFSKVYRAVERPTGETVAVKFLRKDCWHDVRAAEALVREYEILRQLNHPHILAIRGWGTTPRGALFLVTDFISGGNLAEWCERERPDVPSIVRVVAQVAASVAAAHAEHILHGDLKPANLLMRDDGRVVLCDFGLSRHATEPDDVPRGGTAGFLAPEQISDAFGPVTERSDIYGLGGLLYALLSRRPPMTGRDLPELLANVLSLRAPEPPSRWNPAVSAALEEIVMRCLQKEPQRRYAAVQDFSLDLVKLPEL